ARNKSPLATCGTRANELSIRACVPFPAPGGPSSITRKLCTSSRLYSPASHETFVIAGKQMGFNLPDGVDRDAHDDQQGGASEVDGHIEGWDGKGRQSAARAHIDRAAGRGGGGDGVNILGGDAPGAIPGDESALFLRFARQVARIDRDRR